jgi:hypothetical protein
LPNAKSPSECFFETPQAAQTAQRKNRWLGHAKPSAFPFSGDWEKRKT